VLYLYLPDADTSFTGEFFFSYVGCLGSFDTGQLSGAKTGSSFSGTWTGDIDGTQSDGTFISVSSSSSGYVGTWTRTGGSQDFSFGTGPICKYTFAGNGDFSIFKIANGTTTLSVDLINPFKRYLVLN